MDRIREPANWVNVLSAALWCVGVLFVHFAALEMPHHSNVLLKMGVASVVGSFGLHLVARAMLRRLRRLSP